jgi:hypothetical protein
MNKRIRIVGGGLAGLFLGIGLRQRDVPVEIFEAGKYPRHRVCGEFISGRGLRSLDRFGLRESLVSAGAQSAHEVGFFSETNSSPNKRLPEPALSVSRFVLDDLLAKKFCELGGELHSNCRWTGEFSEGIVRATGRRVQSVVAGWRYFGLKVHAQNVQLRADLEMHFVRNGYVGICKLNGGEVNICGLFRSKDTIRDLSNRWPEWLKGAPGSILESRLAGAKFDENSFCSVAGLSLTPQHAEEHLEFSLGDSLTMIPPVTGNGMSMAFESAELALEPLTDFAAGKISWETAQKIFARECNVAFGSRLNIASHLQTALFVSLSRKILLLSVRLPGVLPLYFSLTR